MHEALLVTLVATAALLGACSDRGTVTPANQPPGATAPNPNNPYATDPLDPNMNPHYMRHSSH